MENIVIISVIAVLIIVAVIYIHRAKKAGKACIGCPNSCSGNCQECMTSGRTNR